MWSCVSASTCSHAAQQQSEAAPYTGRQGAANTLPVFVAHCMCGRTGIDWAGLGRPPARALCDENWQSWARKPLQGEQKQQKNTAPCAERHELPDLLVNILGCRAVPHKQVHAPLPGTRPPVCSRGPCASPLILCPFIFFLQTSKVRQPSHGPVSHPTYSVLPYGHDVVVHRGGNRAVPAEHAGEQQQPDISTSASGRQLPRRAAPSQVRRPLCCGHYAVAARRHHADGGRAPGILC